LIIWIYSSFKREKLFAASKFMSIDLHYNKKKKINIAAFVYAELRKVIQGQSNFRGSFFTIFGKNVNSIFLNSAMRNSLEFPFATMSCVTLRAGRKMFFNVTSLFFWWIQCLARGREAFFWVFLINWHMEIKWMNFKAITPWWHQRENISINIFFQLLPLSFTCILFL